MIFNTRLARENWASKYRFGDETELETFQRVCRAVAEVELQYSGTKKDVEHWYDRFLRTLVNFEEVPAGTEGVDIYVSSVDGKTYRAIGLNATPGGRITANAGTSYEKATLWNCFINSPVSNAEIKYTKRVPNTDEIIECIISTEQTPDNLTNIFLSLLEAAETLKSEGGYGVNFGFIRPRGTLIKGVGIRHPGVVSYMELWDKMSAMIVKGDNDGYTPKIKDYLERDTVDRVEKVMPRKGAMMAILPIWHPDIEEFVRAKQERGKLTKFNISVLIDNAFMEAVEADEMYDLHFNGVVHKKIKARDLYDLIMESTFNRAEPGVMFFDNMNQNNPLLYLGPVTASNPCVTGDTWVTTTEGPRQVRELVGQQFTAYVNGVAVESTVDGFWKTGTKETYKVTTKEGYSLRLTGNHLLCRKTEEGEEWVEVDELGVDDVLCLSNQREIGNWGGSGTYDEGWLLGYLVGDGTFRKDRGQACLDFWASPDLVSFAEQVFEDHANLSVDYVSEDKGKERVRLASRSLNEMALSYGITPDTKTITPQVERGSSEFQLGFLRGIFDADGSVQGSQKKGVSVRLHQSDSETLAAAQRMLSRFGVVSTIYPNRRDAGLRPLPDGKGGMSDYYCKAQHELVVSNDNLIVYHDKVGFHLLYKSAALASRISAYKRTPNRERFSSAIESIEPAGMADVYDVSIPGFNEFDANGIRAHNCGEIPGSSFLDKHYKPAPYLKPYVEDWDEHLIGFTTVCLLGSLNLTQFVRPDRSFDYERYEEAITTFTRFLDNINDMGEVPLPAYEWAVKNIRQFGMGVNGLGSALYMMGLQYGSEDALAFTQEIHEIKDEATLRESAYLAKDRGAFPMYDERYLETPYFKNVCTASEKTRELVRKYGVRNAKRLTNPPLGNSSVICDMVSNGIEPVFSHGYERTIIADKWPEGLTKENVKDVLDEIEVGDATAWRGEYKGRVWYYEPHNRGLCFIDEVEDYGFSWVKKHFPEDVENEAEYLVTAQNLKVAEHVSMQAKIQESCDQSVSKTASLPNDYPFEDFKDLYAEAWRAGLVGFTTYREGTMENVLSTGHAEFPPKKVGNLLESLIEIGAVPEHAAVTDENVVVSDLSMPDMFDNGPTHTIRREGNKYYMHLSYLPNDSVNPVALWIHSNHLEEGEYVTMNRAFRAVTKLLLTKGVDHDLVLDQVDKIHSDEHHVKLGKIISMALRHNITIAMVVGALSDIEGDYIATTLSAVRKFLTEHIPDGTEIKGEICEACGGDDLVYESGCSTCRTCGNSGCG